MWAAGEPEITKARGINKLNEMKGRKTTASTEGIKVADEQGQGGTGGNKKRQHRYSQHFPVCVRFISWVDPVKSSEEALGRQRHRINQTLCLSHSKRIRFLFLLPV